MFDIAVVGTATEDVFVNVPASKIIRVADADDEQVYLALDYGAKISVDSMFISIGGGSTNTAAGLARMGLKTAAVAKLGPDEAGDRVVRRLQALGIDTSCFVRTDENFTGLSVILTGYTGDRTILTYRGASAEFGEDEVRWDVLGQVPWMYVGSMSGQSAPLFVRLAEFAGEKDVNLALNPGSHQLRMGYEALQPALKHCTVLFLNKREAYTLTGVEPHRSGEDERRMFEILHRAGCQTVFMTAGSQGAEASDGRNHYQIPAYRTQPVSTVGAGDAFAAGALTALVRGESLELAMKIGALNAASVVQKYGATEGLTTWEEALRYVAECEPGEPCPVQPSSEPVPPED